MISAKMLYTFAFLTVGVFGQTISFGSLTVPATSSTGTSFMYSGSMTQAATIALTVTGAACEQGSGTYCTNGAGVLTIAGSSPVGATTSFSGSIGGFTGTWNFGALIMTITGVGSVQIFPANAANGLGSGAPASSLSLPATSLSALGFPNFTAGNPTITFTVADTNYGDNSGGFTVTSAGSTPPATLPAPGTLVLVILGMAMLTLGWWMERTRRTRSH